MQRLGRTPRCAGRIDARLSVQGIEVKYELFLWNASGRAIANGRDEGVAKLLFDDCPEAHGHSNIVGMAAEVAHGSCTDLPPHKK